MKKNIKFLVLFFVLFFSFGFSANAKEDIPIGIDFESHEHFNYFYELKYQTPFYMFLNSQGENLPLYLNSYNNDKIVSNNIKIFYSKEFESVLDTPGNSKYLIVVPEKSNPNLSTVQSPALTYDVKGNNYIFIWKNYYTTSNWNPIYKYFKFPVVSNKSGANTNGSNYCYYFDEEANLLSHDYCKYFLESYNYENDDFEGLSFNLTGGNMSQKSANFSYFISSNYSGKIANTYTTSTTYNFVVTDIYLGKDKNEHFYLDNKTDYTSFIQKIRSIIKLINPDSFYDDNGLLEFFRKNKVFKVDGEGYYVLNGLIDMLKKIDDYPFNDKFNFKMLGLKDDSWLFVPKKGENLDYNLYAYSLNSSLDINVLPYNIKDNNFDFYKDYLIFNPIANRYFKLDLDTIKVDAENTLNLDTNSAYYIYTSSSKYSAYIYYDTRAYDVLKKNSEGNFVFSNPNTDNEVSVSIDIIDKDVISTELELHPDDNEESSFMKNLDLSATGIFKTVIDWLKSFSGLLTVFFGSIFTVFELLPLDIQYLFYFLLISTVILIIIKIVRGG